MDQLACKRTDRCMVRSNYPARALRALGLLLADGTPTGGRGEGGDRLDCLDHSGLFRTILDRLDHSGLFWTILDRLDHSGLFWTTLDSGVSILPYLSIHTYKKLPILVDFIKTGSIL